MSYKFLNLNIVDFMSGIFNNLGLMFFPEFQILWSE
jgi:hypothetical protein